MNPRVLVLAWDAQSPVEGQDAQGRDFTRLRVVAPLKDDSLLAHVAYFLRLPPQLWRLWKLVKRYRVAVVNCHYVGASEPTWAIAKALGVFRGKLLLSLHGQDIRNLAALGGAKYRFWRWVLRRADIIVACSEGLARETVEKFRLRSEHVVTIHNGFDAARLAKLLESADAPLERGGGGPLLLNLGTFERKKGHDVLLHAFRKIVDRVPTARLTIMGRKAETTESTRALVGELGLAQHVTLQIEAPHSVALAALRAADVFVLPSRNEAFSIALLEAGAFGKPVVATDVCGVAELIDDRRTGILVPADDVERLARGIFAMLEDPRAAAEYGRQLRHRVTTEFRAEETCRKYLRLAGCEPVPEDGGSSLPDRVAVGR